MFMLNMFTYAKLFTLIPFLLIGLTACQNEGRSLEIQRDDGSKIPFNIDVAKSPEEQSQGLMFVEQIDDDYAMLFSYAEPQFTKFWMQNTLIPLDMLFFDPENKLVHIEYSAIPGDLSPRGPELPICSVLEINGGLAKKLNIIKGAKLITNHNDECLQSSIN